ncbi:RagB/SusD family nutrient uptake outer membrane protein [Marinilabilia rubra]|uniref:RagB/SusD family nutrient uptake outer membrane protein n=1 Tax=Marinilabilia rubra TaxID=2162893 RepID=A0A2U2BB76_9BACT|nr:RagB/SusD family nutrient uptake outer membrane protein [Marinilabilia rubra]PWE00324.1 RagB/SusD family nutrient uptake outer membrane protein [Marinilabilia rubra]
MKALKYIKLLVLGGLIFTACEELELGDAALDTPPELDVTVDTVFTRLEYAERYLYGAYTTLPYGLNTNWSDKGDKLGMDILESLTDLAHSYLAWGGSNQLYYSGQYAAVTENSSSKTKFHFSKEQTWEGIRNGWIFIENADKIPDVEDDYREQLKAEAKMVIALHYTDMFRHYGGLPWVNRSYVPGNNNELPRLTARATVDSISKVIDEAVPHLLWQIEDASNWDGRFTKAGALGLKARLLLFAASPLFNDDVPYLDGEAAQQKMVWYGGKDQSLWSQAAAVAENLIEEAERNGYALVNTGNPRQDFQDAYYKRGNGEILISTRVRYESPGWWSGAYYFYQSAGNYGTACPTQEYVDMFGMANGLPIDDPASGFDPSDPFENRDPRLYETVLVNGDTYQGRTAELWIGGRDRKNANFKGTKTGYGLRKFLLERNTATSVNSVIHWPYLRLAEIYLTAAEALNEANGGPTAKAYSYVNKVRERVGLGNLQEGLSQIEFREAVLEERAKEFGYEEVRWFDLVRWKSGADFTKTLHGTDLNKNLVATVKELPDRYWQLSWSPKWYLSAFPTDEVIKGYGIVQNPGWE